MGLDKAKLTRIDDWLQRAIDSRRFAGASVLIREGGEDRYFRACGQRDLAAGLPFARDTVARIYSMTKPVTSLALMQLVERGLVHLDAPVSAFLPGFDDCRCLIPQAADIDQVEPCATPTLHQLLTHTAGMSYGFNPGTLGAAMAERGIEFRPGGDLDAMIAEVAQLPLAFRPGSRWEYSVGIDVIGKVIEVITGRSLAEVFADQIFAPLGMSETGFSVPAAAADRFAALYSPLPEGTAGLVAAGQASDPLRLVEAPEGSPYHQARLYSGGGGLVGTIDDYMRFAEMLRRGGQGIIGPATLDFMMRNHLPGEIAAMGPSSFAEQPMEGMGFGIGGAVVLDPARARVPGSVGDFSWGGIASTFFWLDRQRDLSVVFFTQLMPSSAYPARAELKALVQGALSA